MAVTILGEIKEYILEENPQADLSGVDTIAKGIDALARYRTQGGGGGGGTSGGGAGLESITWSALKAKRDGGTLTPGGQYRITDYVCTTTQDESRAVSHPYDIIVVADSDSVLNENARAIAKDNDTYYQYADLSTWELKYCIDNDTDRFKWADTTNGKGVVYWLKDDHNNECPYDFKQIQFKRYEITECSVSSLVGMYTALDHGNAITEVDGDNPVWCYTFSYDPEETGTYSDSSVMLFDADNEANVTNNKIGEYHEFQDVDEETGSLVIYLNDIVFLGSGCFFNTFGDDCHSNTFEYCYSNTFGEGCSGNTFGEDCYSDLFGDYCVSNTFGDLCNSNTFGDLCNSNTFGGSCHSNTFGGSCHSNTFGNYCQSNTFSNYCDFNTFGDYCDYNMFGNYCGYIDLSAGSAGNLKRYYHVLSGTQGTNNSHISITGTNGNNYVTYVGKNSSGTLKTWVPADLAT